MFNSIIENIYRLHSTAKQGDNVLDSIRPSVGLSFASAAKVNNSSCNFKSVSYISATNLLQLLYSIFETKSPCQALDSHVDVVNRLLVLINQADIVTNHQNEILFGFLFESTCAYCTVA